jgi:hypothetical protein
VPNHVLGLLQPEHDGVLDELLEPDPLPARL